MYSIKVQPPDESSPVIDRSLSSNNIIEILPVVIQICRAKFHMVNPKAFRMGNNVYHIFDLHRPSVYAKVSIIKDMN